MSAPLPPEHPRDDPRRIMIGRLQAVRRDYLAWVAALDANIALLEGQIADGDPRPMMMRGARRVRTEDVTDRLIEACRQFKTAATVAEEIDHPLKTVASLLSRLAASNRMDVRRTASGRLAYRSRKEALDSVEAATEPDPRTDPLR